MLFHLFLLVLIIYTLFFFYTDVMNKINTNKPFAEGFSGTAPNGGNYHFASESKTFMEHYEAALAMGGNLASIHSAEDNQKVLDVIPDGLTRVWIGAIRKRPHSDQTAVANAASGRDPRYWAWTDGSEWNYANWRNGEPNDCCKAQTGNIGEIYGEIQKSDGKWNDIFHQHNGNIQKFPAVYKLNVVYPNTILTENQTDGSKSWQQAKELCEADGGKLPSRRQILNFIKGKPAAFDKWAPTSDSNNSWLEVGNRKSRSGLSPDYGLLHQDIPDVAYNPNYGSGDGKPTWGTTNTAANYRKSIYCEPPAASGGQGANSIGKLVTYEMLTDKSDFCGTDGKKSTKMEWSGEVCEGGKIKWNSMKSLAGTTRPDQAAGCSWNREGKSDAWITKYLGSCGVSPTYVSLPTTVTELQSKKGSIGEFDYWRKKYLGARVETEVSSSKPYGSIVANWDECKNVLNTNPNARQVVYSKSNKACYPMKEMAPEDQDGKGGTNNDWISAQKLYANGPVSGKCALEYCNTYPDLKKAFCDDKECTTKSQAESCINHWYMYGINEGRKPNPVECTQQEAGAFAASSGMDITTSTSESSRIDPTTGAKVTEKCVTVSELNTAAKWVDHLFGTLSNTKCADKDKVMAAKTASKTDFISGVIKGYQNDREGSNRHYMEAINKAKPMLDAAFSGSSSGSTSGSQHSMLQGQQQTQSIQHNVTASMTDDATNGLDQNSEVPEVGTEQQQIVQTPAYQQAMNQINGKNGNYQMANGNLIMPATGNCPNGCRAPQYDNEKCSNQMLGGKAYRNCPWIGDGSINDSMCKDCGSVLLPKNEYGYARTRPGLFNNNTLNNLLTTKEFNKEPKNPNINYTNIGLEFMNELAMARNFTLPYIPQSKYESIGKIVNKYQLNENTGNTNRKDLTDLINSALNSGKLPSTLRNNNDNYKLQTTLNEVKNDKNTQRSENIIKGLLGSNEYYKTSSAGLAEKKEDNRLGGSKTLYSGYTTTYRPKDPRKGVKAYDSIWELFKN